MSIARFLRLVDSHSQEFRPYGSLLAPATALALLLLLAGAAPAQRKPAAKPKIPRPEEQEWETRDGVILKATFLPGTRGKDTVPIILLHGYEGSRNDYAGLARYLQAQGHAVIVPDLRGHGDSVGLKNDNRKLKASTMPGTHFERMVTVDVEKVKSFLMEKNNAGELNIEKLCIVGSRMGAVVAMKWALQDWSWPQLPRLKQGQDVKALVLISPEWSFRTLKVGNLFRNPGIASSLSVLIVDGDKSRSAADARRIHTMFERLRPKPKEPNDKDLFKIDRKTSLQGIKLLNEPAFQTDKLIEQFIKLRLVNQSYPWTNRRSPLQKAGP